MSKVKLLLDVISDVRSLVDSLQAVADAMVENEQTDVTETPTPVKETKKPKKKEIKLEDVRGLLAEKSQAGMTVEVRELIKKYGASKLSEIDPAYYVDIMKDAEVLANG